MNNKPRARNPETSKLTFPLPLTEKLRRATMIKGAHGACGAKYKTIKRKSKPCAGARREKKMKLTKKDLLLIQAAREAISANYDETKEMHTVGAAVRCKNGKVYVGVNVYSIHGACAEQVALGTAITQERTPIRHHGCRCGQTGRKTAATLRKLPSDTCLLCAGLQSYFANGKGRGEAASVQAAALPIRSGRIKNANAPLSFWERRFLLPAILQIKA